MKGHASRLSALEARVSNIETVTATFGGQAVWDDKYADNHRLRADLEAAHAEIRRLGGVIPEPCGLRRVDLAVKTDGHISGFP